LSILGFAYKERPQAFEKVLEIGGRRRRYFGRSQQEIISSGRSTHPKKIPGAPFWVMTNADTRQKCDMLRQTLRVLGYSDDDIRAADNAVF
jgi:negative modulator of initiation of replication